jgi:type II secretory pathway pseudopilin PulG
MKIQRFSHSLSGRKRRGNTFIELMFAMALVIAGGLIFAALVPPAVKTERMMSNYQQATSILQHKVDQLKGVGWGRLTYTELTDAGIIDSSPGSSPYSFATVDNLTGYYRAATGTIAVSDFSSSIKQVVVTVTWTGSKARQGNGSLSVTTLIARG